MYDNSFKSGGSPRFMLLCAVRVRACACAWRDVSAFLLYRRGLTATDSLYGHRSRGLILCIIDFIFVLFWSLWFGGMIEDAE
jgi:hypothetical protein